MADRVVNVKLKADVSEYTASLAKAAAATRGLGNDVEKTVDRDVNPVMSRSGDKSGGLLAQGMRTGFMRQSPLIVAGVAAALSAGAPVILASATALFGGVGAIAAAQTVGVRSAWTEMGHDIRDAAVEDAAVLVPVYERMTDKIATAFQRMRPELRDAFAAAGPQIDGFTDSLTRAAENALPGLVRAVERGGPVIDGLGSLMESVGTGISDMFDAMSDDNANAAGEALASIGDALEQALPLLGELLGTGSELASTVLPPLAAALGTVRDLLHSLGPVIPAVAAGLASLKIAQAASGWLGGVGAKLADFSTTGGLAATTAGRVGTGLSAIGRAAPIVGVGIGLVGYSFARGAEEGRKFSDAAEQAFMNLSNGGMVAVQARQQLDALQSVSDRVGNSFGTFGSQLPDRLRDAASAAHDAEAAMTPLERATRDVGAAQDTLQLTIERYGPASYQAKAAADQLTAAQAEQERINGNLERAIDGVTQAMIEQADQAMAGIDSTFAYRNSIDQLEDAQSALADAQAHVHDEDEKTRTSAEDVQRAQLALEEQTYRTALAYGQQQADLSGLSQDSAEYARIIQEQTLSKLHELQAAAGPQMAAAIQTQINALTASGVALSGTATSAASTRDRMKELGIAVTNIPGSKAIVIDAPTEDQRRRLKELGLIAQTMPNGKIIVTADTSPAAGTLAAFMNQRRSIQIQVNTVRGTTYQGAGQQPTAATGGAIENGQVRHYEIGGAVRGPGGPKADRVPAMLSNGEHVWTAREVQAAGGQKAVADIRRAVLAGREVSGGMAGSVAGGGPVSVSITGAQIVGTLDLGEGITARIDGRIVSALTGATNRGRYNG